MQLRFFIAIYILVLSSHASAWELFNSSTNLRNSITISGDLSQFSLPGGSIQGTGVKVDYARDISDKSAVELFLSTALSSGQSVSTSFTGISAHYFYRLTGNCCDQRQTVAVNSSPVVVDVVKKRQSLQLGLGVNQYFLNGSRTVYSASGLGVAANYNFRFKDVNLKAQVRYAQLVASSVNINGLFLSLGVNFPF